MPEPLTLSQAFVAAASSLRHGGIDTPELDARLLLCHAAALSHEAYIARAGDTLAPAAAARLDAAVARRLEHEPVARITGDREFYGRSFRVDPSVLDPRADTETLIEAALAIVDQKGWRERPLRLLDLGTGSGCILAHPARRTALRPRHRHRHQPRRARLRRRQCRPAGRRRSRRLHCRQLARRRLRPIRPHPRQPALHRLGRDRPARRRRGGLRPASCARRRPRRARGVPGDRRPGRRGARRTGPAPAGNRPNASRCRGGNAARSGARAPGDRAGFGRKAARGCGRVVTGDALSTGSHGKKTLGKPRCSG